MEMQGMDWDRLQAEKKRLRDLELSRKKARNKIR